MEKVIFRKEKNGSIIAVFPYIISDPDGNVLCYAPYEGHGSISWDYYISNTKPCKETEYKELEEQLEDHYGYSLEIVQRRDYDAYMKAWKETTL